MAAKVKRLVWKSELKELARELKVRPDWHEPDEQEVDAVVVGNNFDNAGFWPRECAIETKDRLIMEKYVIIKKNGKPVATVNLATLLAWACDTCV